MDVMSHDVTATLLMSHTTGSYQVGPLLPVVVLPVVVLLPVVVTRL
jgi:hypothetical protein